VRAARAARCGGSADECAVAYASIVGSVITARTYRDAYRAACAAAAAGHV
jgi:hypothetical protein